LCFCLSLFGFHPRQARGLYSLVCDHLDRSTHGHWSGRHWDEWAAEQAASGGRVGSAQWGWERHASECCSVRACRSVRPLCGDCAMCGHSARHGHCGSALWASRATAFACVSRSHIHKLLPVWELHYHPTDQTGCRWCVSVCVTMAVQLSEAVCLVLRCEVTCVCDDDGVGRAGCDGLSGDASARVAVGWWDGRVAHARGIELMSSDDSKCCVRLIVKMIRFCQFYSFYHNGRCVERTGTRERPATIVH
jgi:hypothetical protein